MYSSPATFDAWTLVTLPNGSNYGPIINANLTMISGGFINRDRSQAVPATAPEGEYTYHAYVGHYPGDIWDEASFTFTKLAISDGGVVVPDWNNFGADFGYFEDKAVAEVPIEIAVVSAYPNPFNPETGISFSLTEASFVSLKIYDITGREVANLVEEYKAQGSYEVTFNASDLSSGVYFAKFEAGNTNIVKKLVLLK